MLRVGSVPEGYTAEGPDILAVDEGNGYHRSFPSSATYPLGILRFKSTGGIDVFSWQVSGNIDGKGNYLGEMAIGDGLSLEYLYSAQGHADHRRISYYVERWHEAVNTSSN